MGPAGLHVYSDGCAAINGHMHPVGRAFQCKQRFGCIACGVMGDIDGQSAAPVARALAAFHFIGQMVFKFSGRRDYVCTGLCP